MRLLLYVFSSCSVLVGGREEARWPISTNRISVEKRETIADYRTVKFSNGCCWASGNFRYLGTVPMYQCIQAFQSGVGNVAAQRSSAELHVSA